MVITEFRASLPSESTSPAALAADRARRSRAASTRRAYESDWRDYLSACRDFGLPERPTTASVAIYLDQLARRGAKVSTIRRRLAAVNYRLRMSGSPALSARDEPLASVLLGIRREIGAPLRQARPIEVAEIRSLVAACPSNRKGMRDRALLLLGFSSALRRSELVGLDWDADGDGDGWVERVPEGLRLHLRRSKTNQMGKLEEVAVCRGAFAATCPVAALEAWRQVSGGKGPVFVTVSRHGQQGGRMSGGSIARVLKRCVARASSAAGASDEEAGRLTARTSGHSLRAGLVTAAFAAGLTAEDVMRQTRHRDVKVLLGYRRHATAFVGNVSGRVGL
ncbi:tyrosine-type recombinase/integrase [Brevundimonas goettingensis]|uniref:Tyrosine-type recombinase/integrase n=1 Tax=Brevundimonas goettingensis TaxID=2774190 RepID=A0A975GVC8_9CAUL|nr:tyrosine-type recombinase/integrase [Brevundimonas goettingensis]QTC90473.1 tyrosine-type recombinase/integrase [Brevundimonas goettingensis]